MRSAAVSSTYVSPQLSQTRAGTSLTTSVMPLGSRVTVATPGRTSSCRQITQCMSSPPPSKPILPPDGIRFVHSNDDRFVVGGVIPNHEMQGSVRNPAQDAATRIGRVVRVVLDGLAARDAASIRFDANLAFTPP